MNRVATLAVEARAYDEAMLEAVAARFEGAQIAVACDASLQLSPGQAAAVEEIVREALLNAVRHAFPHGRRDPRIWISLAESGGRVRLAVCDNGVGFAELGGRPRLGLDRIAALAHALGGYARLDNRNYGGAEVSVVFPLST